MLKRSLIVALAVVGWTGAANAIPTNAGFEAGLTGWTSSGGASAIGSLGPILAPEGSLMGFITTGSGAVGGTTSSLTQSFAALVAPFTFFVDFLTDESTPTGFNDTLTVANQSGTLLTLDTNSAFGPAPGTGFNEQTGSVAVVLPVGSTSVTFTVFDVGDAQVDSAALIDIAAFPAIGDDIPEPGTLALFGAGLLGLGLVRRRRRTA